MHGLTPTVVTDVGDVSPDRLEAVRVVALFTIGETPWSARQKEAMLPAPGNEGICASSGVHSATDANHVWPEYGTMLGARFDGHPWTQDFAIDVVDDDHPATVHLVGTRSRSGSGATRSISSPTSAPTPTSSSAWPTTRSTSRRRAAGYPTAASPWPGSCRTDPPAPSTARSATSPERGRRRRTCSTWPEASPG